VPSVEQIRHVVRTMPDVSDVEKRDRALVALALMTGARDDALASLRLRHVDLEAGFIEQDAQVVRTKFSKTFRTYFVTFGDDIQEAFESWVRYLRDVLHWGPDDPLFPRTRIVTGNDWRFEASGLERVGWRSSGPIRAIFRKAFEAAGFRISIRIPSVMRWRDMGRRFASRSRTTRLSVRILATPRCTTVRSQLSDKVN
jgi:integrase/recombinase XerD